LPCKFKIGLAIPEDNTIDVLTNDLAIVALFDGERLAGYNFLLGGGHGMTHNNPKTYPRLAIPVAFVAPEDLLEAAAAVVRLHRDHGDRGNRRHARLKYLIAEHGEDWARERLSDYLGIPVSSGRIADDARSCVRTALRKIVERFRCNPILMPSQDIILSDIGPRDRNAIEGLLRDHGVRLAEDIAPAER
jgi:sulfite reductase (ferredoxin)